MLGVLLLITMLVLTFGLNPVRRILAFPGLTIPISVFLLRASALTYFVSAMAGFIIIILQLPINDKSFMILPFFIAVLIFGGATLGVFQDYS